MKKQTPRYWTHSIELLEKKWHSLSDKREKLVNRVSKYDAQMRDIKDTIIIKRAAKLSANPK